MHIFAACAIAFMIEYLSNDNKGNPNKKPHSSAHFLLLLFWAQSEVNMVAVYFLVLFLDFGV